MPHPLGEHFRLVSAQLLELDSIFGESEKGRNYRIYFREFLEANELELALHTVCDFLLETCGPAVDTEIVARIDSLHQQMSIDDDCSARLAQMQNAPNTPSS
jgi:hypothetical protein